MNTTSARPLKNLTADDLRPLWSRLDIPTRRIAKVLGVTRAGLSSKARALGLPSRVGNKEPMKLMTDETFTRMWMAGVKIADMARVGGYAQPTAIGQRRILLGLPARSRAQGTGNKGGWAESISLSEFNEIEMARIMKESHDR